MLRVLWRRRLWWLGLALGATAAALLITAQMPRRYTAQTLLMVDARAPRVVEVEAVIPGLDLDSAAVHSEVEVLRSRALAEAVVAAAGLEADPAFNPFLAPPPPWQAWLPATPETAETAALAGPRTVEAFQDALSVSALGRSRVVAVRVTTTDPRHAARLADLVAALYLERQRAGKVAATGAAADWLGERLESLRARLAEAEAAVAAYRAGHGLPQAADGSLTAQQRAELNSQLVLARADRAAAEARLAALRRAETAGTLDGTPAVVASPLVQRLREQESQIERRIADLSTRYGDLHPRLIEARAERDGLRQRIQAEAAKLVAAAAGEAQAARSREAVLEQGLAGLEKARGREGEAALRLGELEREARAARDLYESFLARREATLGQLGAQEPDARVVSAAAVPSRPSFPRLGLSAAAAGGAGLLVGLALAFMAERLDRGLRRPEDAARRLGLPVLAQTPLARRPAAPPEVAMEEMRTLRAALALGRPGAPPRVVAITAALPGEGKTTLAAWLAGAAAETRRVLLIDADLRRPALAPLVAGTAPPTLGLAEVLSGEASLEAALHRLDDRLSLLAGRPVGGAAAALLAGGLDGGPGEGPGEGLAGVLARARDRFDLVVIDTPPVLPVADARLLAGLADAVVYAVRWDHTPADVAAAGLAVLAEAGVRPAGLVLTRVDLRRQASYGYGGAVRHYAGYGAYGSDYAR